MIRFNVTFPWIGDLGHKCLGRISKITHVAAQLFSNDDLYNRDFRLKVVDQLMKNDSKINRVIVHVPVVESRCFAER